MNKHNMIQVFLSYASVGVLYIATAFNLLPFDFSQFLQFLTVLVLTSDIPRIFFLAK